MRKYLAALATLALVALAFFLPAWLLELEDQQRMDVPHITREEEEREGFAESLQLTVGEKLLFLRSGSPVNMDAGGIWVSGLYTVPPAGESAGTIEHGQVEFQPVLESETSFFFQNTGNKQTGDMQLVDSTLEQMVEEAYATWDRRLLSAWSELRVLQSLGGLPDLWKPGYQLEYICSGETLYIDAATRVSFQVYTISFSCSPYTLHLTVDEQSGRVLRFSLEWSAETQLNWGLQGEGSFGPAWRDYWRMDNVGSSCFTPYIKEILASSAESLRNNGEYNANGQIVFVYDGQSLAVNLSNQMTYKRGSFLMWNM